MLLQAKKRGGDEERSPSATLEANPVQKNEEACVSEESMASSNQEITCQTDAHGPDMNSMKDQAESTDFGKELSVCGSLTAISSSEEPNSGSKEVVGETGKESDMNAWSSNFEAPASNQVAFVGADSSAISSSDEFNCCGKKLMAETEENGVESDSNEGKSSNNESSKPISRLEVKSISSAAVAVNPSEMMSLEMKIEKSSLDDQADKSYRKSGSDHTGSDDKMEGMEEVANDQTISEEHMVVESSKKPTGRQTMSEEDMADTKLESTKLSVSPSKRSHAYCGSISSTKELADNQTTSEEHMVMKGNKAPEDQRTVSEENMVDTKLESTTLSKSPSKSSHAYYGSVSSTKELANDQTISGKHMVMESNEKPNHHQTVSEEDMVETKLQSTALSKSPTKNSHAYYGSVSSNGDDGDDHVTNHQMHLLEKKLKHKRDANSFNSKGGVGRPTQESDSELRPQERKLLSMSLNEKNGLDISGSICSNQDEASGPTGYGFQAQEHGCLEDPDVFHSVRSWMESDRNVPYRFPSRDLNHRMEFIHRDGGRSSYRRGDHSRGSSSYASDKLETLEQGHLELLRKVEELKDHLYTSYGGRGKLKERFHSRGPKLEKWRPSHSNHEWEQELLHRYNFKHPWNPPGSYVPRKALSNPYAPSRMSSTEQATNCRHHVDYSCLYCHPQEWQPSFSCKSGSCRSCTSHTCYHLCSSSIASSPQRNVDHSSRLLSVQPHVQMEKRYMKEKPHMVKRYCRPMAGGAPFVICYRCWKVLQLPADFLLSRRHHKLQCGSCSAVIKFPLRNSDEASSSHVGDAHVQGDPISYSDDYALSLSKSFSTEGDPIFQANPFPAPQSAVLVGKNYASSSTAPKRMEEKKKLVPRQSIKESQVSRSVIPSSNAPKSENSSLEVNEGTPMTCSPLHQLWGYSSPSEMINASDTATSYHAKNVTEQAYFGSGTSSPVHDHLIHGPSRNSSNLKEEDELPTRSKNSRDSSLPGFIKKRFENMKHKISLNGRVIPDQLVKRGEEKAEPHQHGKYG